jgi:hypothetical protein
LVLLGVGQVKIEQVALTDGRTSLPVAWKVKVLGRPAPQRGLPELDWTKRQAVLPLRWRPARTTR